MRKHVEESVATGAAAGRGRGGRFSVGRKREVVMRLLRGEDLESVSRAVGITAARASHWRAQFLAAGQAGLKSRATDARDEDHRRLQAKIGELLIVREPEGNGVAERFIRTLKENLLWVRSFDTIEEFRLALLAFKRTYNEQWMLEKYHYRSPAQVRRGLVGGCWTRQRRCEYRQTTVQEPWGATVCPAKAGVFSGSESHRGKSQRPRSLDSSQEGNRLV